MRVAYLHDDIIKKTYASVLDISKKAWNLSSLRRNKTYSSGDFPANNIFNKNENAWGRETKQKNTFYS